MQGRKSLKDLERVSLAFARIMLVIRELGLELTHVYDLSFVTIVNVTQLLLKFLLRPPES